MVELFSKIMNERRAHPEVKHQDALQMFMDFRYKDGTVPTDEEVTGKGHFSFSLFCCGVCLSTDRSDDRDAVRRTAHLLHHLLVDHPLPRPARERALPVRGRLLFPLE